MLKNMSFYWRLFDHDPTVAKVMSDFKTFATWPLRNSTPTPKDFAMAGLAYDPEKRILSCSMCQQKTQLSTIVASDETLPQGLHESDCDAPLRTLSPDVSAVVTERALAFRPEFQTYTARFASFDARPKEEDVFDVDYMASAGFYYLTDRTVECFCCGLRLLSWEADYDDPVEEHAKYNPRCPYLRLCASVTYIKEVSDVYRNSDLFWLLEYTKDIEFVSNKYSLDFITALATSKFDLSCPNKLKSFLENSDSFSALSVGRPYPTRIDKTSISMKRSDPSTTICVVCMNCPVCIVTLPCAHAALCLNCLFPMIYNSREQSVCCLCKSAVSGMYRIH